MYSKQTFIVFLLTSAAIMVMAVGIAFGANDSPYMRDSTQAAKQSTVLAGHEAQANVITVEVHNFVFVPQTVTIQAGDIIIWHQISGTHNVSATNSTFRNSDPISTWVTYTHTFSQAGEFQYVCEKHKRMIAAVIVQPLPTPTATFVPTAIPTATATLTPTTPIATPQPDPARIEVGNDFFGPEVITITAGSSVTWTQLEGFHNVVADDGSFHSGVPSNSWTTYSHTFNAAGEFRYYCESHGSPGGIGMAGKVIVLATETPAATPTLQSPANRRVVYLPVIAAQRATE